ncbi:hypothetical protein GPALN_014366 [Globodera pallida]|nr:hypothetical protein GPALN_014366 [Globodera pallida]
MAILADLQYFWDCFGNDFWLNEKNIRKAIGQFVRKNGGKMPKLKQPFWYNANHWFWPNVNKINGTFIFWAKMSWMECLGRHVGNGISAGECGMPATACREGGRACSGLASSAGPLLLLEGAL